MADPRARFLITADGSDYKRKLRAALRDTRTFAGSVNQALKRGGLAASAGLATATAGLIALTRASNQSVDALAKQSDLLGITTEKLAAYQLATRLSGGTNQQFEKGLLKIQKAITDARNGLTTYTRAFDALNLSPNQLETLTPDQQFEALARAFSGVENQTRRVAIAYDLFGGRNTALLNTLVLTGTQLNKIEADTKAWNVALSRVDAKQIENANDQVERARTAVTGIGNTIAIALAPLRGQLAQDFADSAAEAQGFRAEVQSTFESLVVGANVAANAIRGIEIAFLSTKLAFLELQRLAGADERRQRTLNAGGVPGVPSGSIPEDLERQLNARARANLGPSVTERLDETGKAIDAVVSKLQTADEAIARFRQLQADAAAAARNSLEEKADPLTGFTQEELAALDDRNAERAERLAALAEETQRRITRATKKAADDRIKLETQAERAIQQQKQQTASLAVGLLQALGAENRGFAIAAIVFEKALAIKRLLLANRVAAELAFASQLIPGDPSSLGRATAAKAGVLAQGKVGAALIAATGAVQIATLGSGSTGAPIGTPVNPLFTDGGAQQVPGEDGRRIIEIRGAGLIVARDLVEILKDEFDADEVVISANTRQAQEIRKS